MPSQALLFHPATHAKLKSAPSLAPLHFLSKLRQIPPSSSISCFSTQFYFSFLPPPSPPFPRPTSPQSRLSHRLLPSTPPSVTSPFCSFIFSSFSSISPSSFPPSSTLLLDVPLSRQTTLESSSSRPLVLVTIRTFVPLAARKSPIFHSGPVCRDAQHCSSGGPDGSREQLCWVFIGVPTQSHPLIRLIHGFNKWGTGGRHAWRHVHEPHRHPSSTSSNQVSWCWRPSHPRPPTPNGSPPAGAAGEGPFADPPRRSSRLRTIVCLRTERTHPRSLIRKQASLEPNEVKQLPGKRLLRVALKIKSQAA